MLGFFQNDARWNTWNAQTLDERGVDLAFIRQEATLVPVCVLGKNVDLLNC
ncbi:MAG: hypothetical protein KA536_15220 [Saprospiraceae bacterium]|nr:hypothetical protein [Saprospiraceae bacterium]